MSNPFDWGDPPPYENNVAIPNYGQIDSSTRPAVLVIQSPPEVHLPSVGVTGPRAEVQQLPSYDEATDPDPAFARTEDDSVFLRTLHTPAIEGYEDVGFEPLVLVPPPSVTVPNESSLGSQRLHHRLVEGVPNLDDFAARDAVLSHISQSVCFGLKAAKEMKINDIVSHSAFRYELQTFTETRKVFWTYEPYTGQQIDDESNGPVPKPWDVLVVPPHPFVEGETTVEVPRTASIQSCFECHTLGRRSCWSCFGNGNMRCNTCSGSGQQTPAVPAEHQAAGRICVHCTGSGRRRCNVCLGPGQIPCKTCVARGRLKVALKMTVSWKTHKVDSVVERTVVPDLHLRDVIGRVAFEEERPLLEPINFFPDESINFASRELLDKHRSTLPAEKIMVQKHSIRLVPVYQIMYEWRRYRGEFYIYGYENRVYFPDYPQQHCCGLREVWPCSMC